MSWIPNNIEIKAVLVLGPSERYAYWVKKVADQHQVWSLWQEGGWALTGDAMNCILVPVWPHFKYAELCAEGAWAGYQPRSIPLEDWLNRWIPGMQQDRRQVAVFPTISDKGICVEPKRLEQDLCNELSNYE